MPVEILAGERAGIIASTLPSRRGQADAKEFTLANPGVIEAKGCKPGPCIGPCKCACLPPPKCGPFPPPPACKPQPCGPNRG